MTNTEQALNEVRDSICAVMRVIRKEKRARKGKASQEVQINLAIVGTAWCIVKNKLLVTAHHVLNDGQKRDPVDRFYVFTVPGNGPTAYHFPVVDFPMEDPKSDIAVLEVGEPVNSNQKIPPIPITFSRPADGTHVLTIGFPAPEIASANVSRAGEYLGGGQFFLKAHANEGIVAAQYAFNDAWYYEFNVGWHHGESGGPVLRLVPEPAVFSIMQHYRNVKTPHGISAGPHRGISLEVVQDKLIELGAKEI